MTSLFLSTLSLRRATRPGRDVPRAGYISIHALLAESDKRDPTRKMRIGYFYPRSPCGERRDVYYLTTSAVYISIHALLAESDGHRASRDRYKNYFYPRSPCGERQGSVAAALGIDSISIHALLAESD